jgi:two-component system nitrate/nitrite response regulator NarL
VALHCLIVDDSATFLDAAAALLEREGVTVVGVASDGAQALARAKELHPDVVLLDIMLGRESGFDVAWRLADSELAGIAVILISTHVEADLEDLIEEVPVAGFLQKSELSANAIRSLIDSDHEESGTRQDC